MVSLWMLQILIWLTLVTLSQNILALLRGILRMVTLWLALLVPGLVSLLLEFPPINYRYFWFVEIWQVWAFKNVSLMMLNLRCQLDVSQSHHGNTPLIFPDRLISEWRSTLEMGSTVPWTGIPDGIKGRRWAEPHLSLLRMLCDQASHTQVAVPYPSWRTLLPNWEPKPTRSFPCFSQAFCPWRKH